MTTVRPFVDHFLRLVWVMEISKNVGEMPHFQLFVLIDYCIHFISSLSQSQRRVVDHHSKNRFSISHIQICQRKHILKRHFFLFFLLWWTWWDKRVIKCELLWMFSCNHIHIAIAIKLIKITITCTERNSFIANSGAFRHIILNYIH